MPPNSTRSYASLQLRSWSLVYALIGRSSAAPYIEFSPYLSKLDFLWPQVSCISGFPPRGTRTIFESYRDSTDEIQQFAIRFSTSKETNSVVNILKVFNMNSFYVKVLCYSHVSRNVEKCKRCTTHKVRLGVSDFNRL
ncbi:uncharacterized protein LOC120075930 isoform X2 [Benincasa hispida]|uniref:uncharacterized protein LOC120075930 isoform X2 n=1 Tax=Benincasa hispida TaxID=102211 RepID=UPI0018FFB621|nr:uncharacterized protein LOC120075930 isoform X2 [Benincasa hispida]